jgi:hypothetical protein
MMGDDQPETILLIGGPANGRNYGWGGGDVFRFVMTPRVPSTIETGPNAGSPPNFVEAIYRRSQGSHIFFYEQPKVEVKTCGK